MVKKKLKLKFQEDHNKMEQFANTSECSFFIKGYRQIIAIHKIRELFTNPEILMGSYQKYDGSKKMILL